MQMEGVEITKILLPIDECALQKLNYLVGNIFIIITNIIARNLCKQNTLGSWPGIFKINF
jgi:hypothetical protein